MLRLFRVRCPGEGGIGKCVRTVSVLVDFDPASSAKPAIVALSGCWHASVLSETDAWNAIECADSY